MLRHATFIIVISLLTGCVTTPTSGSPAKVALVIGNAAYENAPSLKNPINDANDMCAALRRIGFVTMCHTNLPDRAAFAARVEEYVKQLGPNTVGVFYYSGHGVQVGGANFLIPTQAQPKAVAEDPLRVLYGVDDVFDRLRQKSTRLQLVILDACRTDLLPRTPRPVDGVGSSTAARSTLLRSLATVSHASTGLAAIRDAPPSTMVLYATGSNDAAFDGDGRNGPLTKHVLQHIESKGLPLGDFITRVMLGVENETTRDYNKRQSPFIYGSFSGKFCFAGCPGDPPVTIVL